MILVIMILENSLGAWHHLLLQFCDSILKFFFVAWIWVEFANSAFTEKLRQKLLVQKISTSSTQKSVGQRVPNIHVSQALGLYSDDSYNPLLIKCAKFITNMSEHPAPKIL